MQQPEHTQEYKITSRLWSAGSDLRSCDTVNSLLSEDEQEVLTWRSRDKEVLELWLEIILRPNVEAGPPDHT